MRATIALAAVAGAAALAVVAWPGDERPEPANGQSPGPAASLTPRELAGQRIVCGFDGRTAPQSLVRAISAGELAGVILFDDNVRSREQVARLGAQIQAAPRPPALSAPVIVSVDQEGGQVKRLPAPPKASAEEMGRRGPKFSRAQGAATGAALKRMGVNLDLAPVLDVARRGGFIADQDRAFGSKPGAVARNAAAFAAGLEETGVAATAKHFPGLGSTSANTDLRPSTIRLKRGALRKVDIRPYRSFIAAGGSLVMVGSARYPSLGTGKLPAARSKRLVQRELRGRLGFDGVTITDSLEAPGARAGAAPAKVAVQAAAAGMDLLLYVHCDAAMRAARALRAALASGKLDRASFERSVERVLALRSGM